MPYIRNISTVISKESDFKNSEYSGSRISTQLRRINTSLRQSLLDKLDALLLRSVLGSKEFSLTCETVEELQRPHDACLNLPGYLRRVELAI